MAHVAAQYGLLQLVGGSLKLDIHHSKSNSRDGKGRTPLMIAVVSAQLPVSESLMSLSDTQLDCKDNMGRTALSYASEGFAQKENSSLERVHCQLFELLLNQQTVDPNLLDVSGRCPLWYAVDKPFVKAVELLLGTNRVEPDVRDNQGRTPLSHLIPRINKAGTKLSRGVPIPEGAQRL